MDFFAEHKDARTVLLVVGLVIFWVIEGAVPLFSFQYRRVRHAALNLHKLHHHESQPLTDTNFGNIFMI